MAFSSEGEGDSQPESPGTGGNESGSEHDLRVHTHGHKILDLEGTDSELGKEQLVKRHGPGTQEVVNQWDPREINTKDIDW